MNCNSIRKLFVLFLTLFLSVQLFGQKDKYRLAEAPRWVKKIDSYHSAQPSQGQTEGYYYLLINHQKNIEEETNYSEYSVKVLNQSGIQEVSDIFLSFDPSYQEFIFHRFEIIRDGEIINKLNQSEIKVFQREENSERFLYDGRLSIGLNLTDVRVGDIIEYAYSKKGYNPVFEGKFSDKIYLEYSSPIDRYYYKVIANSLSGLNVQTHNGAQEPAISEMEGAITYTWNLKKLESKITDRNYPSWIDPYQFVEISEYESWGEVNNWALNYYSLNDKDKRTLKDLRSTEFKGGNQEEQIMKIIRFVQDEIRYLGFESGLNSHKPHSPIKVYNQRFGDCKDKSFLLSQLLQSIGVEAYPVLVNTVTTKSLNSVLPTPNAFDHCITQLRYKGTSHFIDPTIQNQGGTLSDYSSPNYHYGLVLKDGVKKLESIPVNENSETRVEEYFVLNGVGGVAEMYVNTVYSGSDADSQRSYFASSGLNNIQNNYLDYYSKLYPEIVIKNPIEFIDDRDQNKIVVTESYTINNFWIDNEQNEGQVYCEFYPLTLESYVNINKSLNRSLPYYISYPLNYHHKIKVDLPQEWNASSENLEIKSDSYHYNYSVTYSNEVLDINHSYRTFTDHIKSDDMREFKSDHDKILGNLTYYLTHGGTMEPATFSHYWVIIVLTIISIISAIYLMYRIYFIDIKNDYFEREPKQIGGWLILPAIGIAITPLRVLYDLIVNADLFDQQVWVNLASLENEGLLIFVGVELIYNIFFLFFSVLLAILFFQRRSSVRLMATIFYSLNFVVLLLDTMISSHLLPSGLLTGADNNQSSKEIIQSGVAALIWIPYFNISLRVRETFVVKLKNEDDIDP